MAAIVPSEEPAPERGRSASAAMSDVERRSFAVKAGFFETDITPSLGMERPATFYKLYLTSIHDPLKARAAVFDDGAERVALVGIDTGSISARAVAKARKRVERLCGIKRRNVLIAASHTHAGGPLAHAHPDDWKDAPKLIRELALVHRISVDPLYEDWVVGQIATAICEADRRSEKALLSVGRGHENAAVFNRRFRMKSGGTSTHPGKGHSDIVEPAGPVDPEVGVLAAWRRNGSLIGCVVNYACHGTTLQNDGGISADWVYYMSRTIRGAMGSDAVTVFLNGACGDVTQIDNLSLRETEVGEYWACQLGTRVGAEALKVLVTAEKGSRFPLTVLSRTLKIRRRRPSTASLKESRAVVRKYIRSAKGPAEWHFAKERVLLDYLIRKDPFARLELQAVQVGPAVFLANPAEYFCALGLEIKRRSPFPFTFVVELANGAAGYVPTEEAFEATGGGYETVLTADSNLEPAAGRKIADAGVAMAKRLTPGPLPKGRCVKPATGPGWRYGAGPAQTE